MKRLLILGGTGDAVKLAALTATLPDLATMTSLAGRTTTPRNIVGEVRVGGFGGEAGLIDYLQAMQIDLTIDATHPFAAQMSAHAAQSAAAVGIPHLLLIRPEWSPVTGDRWIEVDSIERAVMAIPSKARRILITVGRQQLAPFASLTDRWCLLRSIEPPDPAIPLPPGELILDRGPFRIESERQLLRDYQIQAIVSKNSGGNATYAKIVAARELGIPVVMVQRPRLPGGDCVDSVAAAVAWVRDWLAKSGGAGVRR